MRKEYDFSKGILLNDQLGDHIEPYNNGKSLRVSYKGHDLKRDEEIINNVQQWGEKNS